LDTNIHQDAFDAHGKASAVVHGANIISPKVCSQPSGFLADLTNGQNVDTEPSSNNFVLTGKVQLFNREDLTVEFYSYHGPAPEGETLKDGEAPVYQMAVLDQDKKLTIANLVPNFTGTMFDSIGIENITFIYQVSGVFCLLPSQ
jgi:hypothetical protein